MSRLTGENRRFLFLQGPHGPFFAALARSLVSAGAACWRVGFNAGDRLFWRDGARFIAYRGTLADWPDALADILGRHRITDIVLYGDTRPIHARASELGRAFGVRVHVFEEGYLRPYWITYERGGANGHSPLMSTTIDAMNEALAAGPGEHAEVPAHWGDMRGHIFYGALYHAAVLAGRRPSVPTHRDIPVNREFRLHLRKLLLMPFHGAERMLTTWRILRGGYPFHLALLQLDHDASFRAWSPFRSVTEFAEIVIRGFAEGAPRHHHLVFKAHPLEDGRTPLKPAIARLAREHGVEGRVHFLRGGKLARLLDVAASAVTVNSTAAQQVLWRGLPLKSFGHSVYDKPELVSSQPLAEFLSDPRRPDQDAYRIYRRYLLETSQIPGGYYSVRSRRRLLRQIADMVLDPVDRYENLARPVAAQAQQFRIVR